MTACFKGLSPSDDDIFDLADEEDDGTSKQDAVNTARVHDRMLALRTRIECTVARVVQVWRGDGEVADVRRSNFLVCNLIGSGYFGALEALHALLLRHTHLTLTTAPTGPRLLRC